MKTIWNKITFLGLPTLFLVTIVAQQAFAATKVSEADLAMAKQSEAYAKETGKDGIATAKEIIAKIDAAAEMLKKDGAKGLEKLKGKGSEYIFGGTYIWVHNMECSMVMHPIKPKLNGKSLSGLKDGKGKRFFIEMNKVAEEKGSGWVEYVWPKPGEKKGSDKVSYVKRVTTKDGDYVIGCGIYDMTVADVEKALK